MFDEVKLVQKNQDQLEKTQKRILNEMLRMSVKMDQILKQQAQFSQGEAAPISDINLKNIGCRFASVEEMDAFENNLLNVDFFQNMVSL